MLALLSEIIELRLSCEAAGCILSVRSVFRGMSLSNQLVTGHSVPLRGNSKPC